MRSRNGCSEARVWKRQPLAVVTSSAPRPCQASRSSSRSLRRVSASISSSNIFRSSEIGSGSCAARRAASSTILTSLGLSMGGFHVDRSIRLGLRDLEKSFPHQLQHREKVDDQHCRAARRLEQVAKLGEPASPQPFPDGASGVPDLKLLAAHAVVLRHFCKQEQPPPSLLEIHHVYLRHPLREGLLDPHLHRKKIPAELGKRVESLRRE